MTTEVHAAHARYAYTDASIRYELVADVVRAMVARESLCRGYAENENDSLAQDCAEVALHALAILRERAGTAPHASIASDLKRVETIRRFLRIIGNAAARIEAAYEP